MTSQTTVINPIRQFRFLQESIHRHSQTTIGQEIALIQEILDISPH